MLNKNLLFIVVLTFWIFLDLLTKNIALKYLQNEISIFSDLFFLEYVENTWVAFSIEIPGLKYLTIILIIAIFYYYLFERKSVKNLKLLDLSFWLILAWAIWNWYERIFNWKVIDFIWIKYFSIFNLADIFISLGAIIYLYILFKNKK